MHAKYLAHEQVEKPFGNGAARRRRRYCGVKGAHTPKSETERKPKWDTVSQNPPGTFHGKHRGLDDTSSSAHVAFRSTDLGTIALSGT